MREYQIPSDPKIKILSVPFRLFPCSEVITDRPDETQKACIVYHNLTMSEKSTLYKPDCPIQTSLSLIFRREVSSPSPGLPLSSSPLKQGILRANTLERRPSIINPLGLSSEQMSDFGAFKAVLLMLCIDVDDTENHLALLWEAFASTCQLSPAFQSMLLPICFYYRLLIACTFCFLTF